MSDWAALTRELDRWAEAGRRAGLWWRDDDIERPDPALSRLIALAQGVRVPLALAVIPATASAALAPLFAPHDNIALLQHGYAHRNHAADGAKKAELGTERPLALAVGELGMGRQRLDALFGTRAVAALVPPWNRIAPGLVPMLPELGYTGLSTYGARRRPAPVRGLAQVNTHVDIVDWRTSRGFVGTAAALTLLLGHLSARRNGTADGAEPTGLLTHHRVHDKACWRFLDALFAHTAGHPGARWLGARELFEADAAAPLARAAGG